MISITKIEKNGLNFLANLKCVVTTHNFHQKFLINTNDILVYTEIIK